MGIASLIIVLLSFVLILIGPFSEGTYVTLCIAFCSGIWLIYKFVVDRKSKRTELQIVLETEATKSQTQIKLAEMSREERLLEDLQQYATTLRSAMTELERLRNEDRAKIETYAENNLSLRLEVSRLTARLGELEEEIEEEKILSGRLSDKVLRYEILLNDNQIRF